MTGISTKRAVAAAERIIENIANPYAACCNAGFGDERCDDRARFMPDKMTTMIPNADTALLYCSIHGT
jgi:hypothetical protein